jgi:nucleoside 2-deoxyribosyltransferase
MQTSIYSGAGMQQQVAIYFAGPDVFKPDYATHKARIKSLCAKYGLIALLPADDTLPDNLPDVANYIYEQNIALINRADIVLANVEDFRGDEPDSGTVFEIGYAIGRGKSVWTYHVPVLPMIDRVAGIARGKDMQGNAIEDFNRARNLMISCSTTEVTGNIEDCLSAVVAHLLKDNG